MRKSSVVAVLWSLLLPAALMVPVVAVAQSGKKKDPPKAAAADEDSPPAKKSEAAGKKERRRDPNNVTGISKFMETCVEGNAKYAVQDWKGAMESYRAAIKLAPKNPLGHYLLGEAQLAGGSPADAEVSFRQADITSDKRDAQMRAKVLFVTADVKERQSKWTEAKAAWQAYNDWVLQYSDGGVFPLSATARIKAIDEQLKADKAMQVVRDRIDASLNETPPADPGK